MSGKPNFLSRVASAPISWGVCEVPGWGHQLSPDRVLGEMSELGFTHTELGSAGWLPREPTELDAVLSRHGMSLLASFVPLVMHDPGQSEQVLADAVAAADLLAASGAHYFNTAPVTSPDWEPRRPLSDGEWAHLFAMLDEVDSICSDHGLLQVVHEHVGCVVETAEEVQAVVDNSSVALVVDTGHLAIGGYDPLALVRRHPERVGLVHLKDTRLDVADRLNQGGLSLMDAVQHGLFTTLGQGDLDLGALIDTLETGGFDGWYVIEQDCAITGEPPAEGDGPIRDVAASLDYLKRLPAAV